jgi:hypothetical protein
VTQEELERLGSHNIGPLLYAKLEADARALWAVRVLDALLARNSRATNCAHCTLTNNPVSGLWSLVVVRYPNLAQRGMRYSGPTADAARIAAAEALVVEDPSLGEGL